MRELVTGCGVKGPERTHKARGCVQSLGDEY